MFNIQGEAKRAATIQPGEEKAQRDPINMCNKHLMGVSKEDGARLFPVVSSERRRGKGHDLKCRKFLSDIRKNFFYCEDGQTLE